MENKFELEIWPDAGKMKKVYLTMIVALIVAWACHFIGSYFWDAYTYQAYSFKIQQNITTGWPVTLYWWGIYLGCTLPFALLLVYFMQDKKNPSLALNKEGIFLNQQLIKQTTVKWNDIAKIEKKKNENNTSIEFYFKDASKIVEAQTGMKKAFVKENLKDNKPFVCEDRFSKGDFDAFYASAKQYLDNNNS